MERYSDTAIDIVNDLHTERLDYNSEYSPLIDALHKLAEYEDAEEHGLLVRSPCKVGDTVWVLRKGGYNLTGLHRGWDYYVDKIRFSYHALDLYDEFYTTREEAKQALKARAKS